MLKHFRNFPVADPGGRGGHAAPLGPLKISYNKKDGCQRRPHRFMFLGPPYLAAGSATVLHVIIFCQNYRIAKITWAAGCAFPPAIVSKWPNRGRTHWTSSTVTEWPDWCGSRCSWRTCGTRGRGWPRARAPSFLLGCILVAIERRYW